MSVGIFNKDFFLSHHLPPVGQDKWTDREMNRMIEACDWQAYKHLFVTAGKYTISIFTNYKNEKVFWFGKNDGEGMEISEETMDKIWKEYF